MGALEIQGNASPYIILPSSGTFSIDSVSINPNSTPFTTSTITLEGFANDTLFIEDVSNMVFTGKETLQITSNGTSFGFAMIAKDSAGNVITLDENQQWAIEDGFLNIISTVPEPAEWAAVFGAFALALAAWRRRK